MRVSFITLCTSAVALYSIAASAHPEDFFEARDYVDGLSARDLDTLEYVLQRSSNELSDISTRDLVDELSSRLERRGNVISKPKFGCPYCGTKYDTEAKAKACATLPQMLGGCKVNDPVKPEGKKPRK